jgi:uncharacterized protein YndB with AHSA1/START domain
MKTTFALVTFTCALVGVPFAGPQTSAAPAKQLMIELEVPAPLPAVWEAFSTSAGLSTWLGPNATVDLRPGGDWMVRSPDGKSGGGTIVSFVPEQAIVISAMAPEQFPTVRAQRTRAVFQFEARGDATVVRLIQTGWKQGPEWDHAYEYLVAGNAELLSMLHRRFLEGPLHWRSTSSGIGKKD